MIKAVTQRDIPRVLAFCGDSFSGARITGAVRSYGIADTKQQVWYEESDDCIQCVLLGCEGIGVLSGKPENAEEWTELSRFAGLRLLTGEAESIRALRLPVSQSGIIMRMENPVLSVGNAVPVDAEHITSLYDVIHGQGAKQANPGSFAAWFVDVSHRVRHGTSRFYAVYENGKPVSCAGMVYENETLACIGAVATLPAYRKKGYASAVVSLAASDILQNGKTPVLARGSDKTKHLYASLGFADCGTWCAVTL